MNFWLWRTMVEAVGWSLLHFIWQGFVIASLLALGLRLLRNAAPQYRYLIGCAAMLLLAVAPLVTFQWVLQPDDPVAPRVITATPADNFAVSAPEIVASSQPPVVVTGRLVRTPPSWRHRLDTMLPWLVAWWLAGVCACSARLFVGWVQIRRLRHAGLEALPGYWEAKLHQLALRLQIARPLRFFRSAWVEVPTVIGWLRPVILLPAACLTRLTPEQLESILAHELAHVRRHDYLVNLLQSVVETLLFYHPAVWWVSRRIREEREHCCDDLAVEVMGNRVAYARALATLEELRPAPAPLALAATGGPLLARIRRLLGQNDRHPNRAGWPIAGLAVLLLTLLLAALSVTLRRPTTQVAKPIAQSANRELMSILMDLTNLTHPADRDPWGNPYIVTLDSKPNGPAAEIIKDSNQSDSTPILFNRTNLIDTGLGRQAITEKLDRIRVDNVDYQDIPLKEVLDDLTSVALARDLEGKGVNFLFSREALASASHAPAIDPTTGLQFAAGAEPPDVAQVKVQLSLHGVRLADVLDAIVKTANKPIKYTIVDYAVVFSLRSPEPVQREIRTFHVDPDTFTQSLEKVTGVDLAAPPSGPPSGNGGISWTAPATNGARGISWTLHPNDGKPVQDAFRAYLTMAGVDLSTNNGNVVIYNTRKGTLTIRSAVQDLDLIEQVVERLNAPANMASNRIIAPPPGRRISEKLKRIEVGLASYSGQPLADVLADLARYARDGDPAHEPINFLYSRETSPVLISSNAAEQLPAGQASVLYRDPWGNPYITSASVPDIDGIKVTLPMVKNLTMVQLADAVGAAASYPLKVTILDYAVVFSPTDPAGLDAIGTRTFHVNSPRFLSRLEKATGIVIPTSDFPDASAAAPDRSRLIENAIRSYFATVGIDLNTSPGKVVLYNDAKDWLIIRATARELGIVEQKVLEWNAEGPANSPPQSANTSTPVPAVTNAREFTGIFTNPEFRAAMSAAIDEAFGKLQNSLGVPSNTQPQINLKIKFVEISQTNRDPIGFNALIANPSNAVTQPSSGGAPSAINPFGVFPGVYQNSNAVVTMGIGSPPAAGPQNATGAPRIATITGILTEAQARLAIQALEQRDGVDILTAPEVTTESGRQAQIQTTESSTIVSAEGTNQVWLGPSVDILAQVEADGWTVDLTISPRVVEFIGYDNAGQFMPAGGQVTTVMPVPHFRLRSTRTVASIRDGETLVLGGLTEKDVYSVSALTNSAAVPQPPPDRASSGHSQEMKKNLLIFITPTLINPDGTRFHSEPQSARNRF